MTARIKRKLQFSHDYKAKVHLLEMPTRADKCEVKREFPAIQHLGRLLMPPTIVTFNDSSSSSSSSSYPLRMSPIVLLERYVSENMDSIMVGETTARHYFSEKSFKLLWSSNVLPDPRKEFLRGYELVGMIGEGGFGQVFRARRLACGTLVAAKIIHDHTIFEKPHPAIMAAHSEVKKVPTEVNALIEMVGVPGVVQLHEIFMGPKMEYILVMEEVKHAKTLSKLIKSMGRMTEVEAWHYFRQIVIILEDMLKRGRHHMDVKGSNILVDFEAGSVKIIDLGGAQRVSKRNFTKWVGTTKYFPPEYQLFNKLYGIPLDSWCLGLLLLKMTTGDTPVSEDPVENSKRSYLMPHVLSRDLKTLIDRCLSRVPRSRPNLRRIMNSKWMMRLEGEVYVSRRFKMPLPIIQVDYVIEGEG